MLLKSQLPRRVFPEQYTPIRSLMTMVHNGFRQVSPHLCARGHITHGQYRVDEVQLLQVDLSNDLHHYGSRRVEALVGDSAVLLDYIAI